MKAYTNLEQSKKLFEFGLPLTSADMFYRAKRDIYGNVDGYFNRPELMTGNAMMFFNKNYYVPCWSLAALISILTSNCNKQTINITRGGWLNDGKEFTKNFFISYEDSEDNDFTLNNKELIDNCVNMIEVLHEQKIL